MSDIQVGDLVMVVRSHCGAAAALGLVETVQRLASHEDQHLICPECGARYGRGWVHAQLRKVDSGWHPAEWLKKIPPLEEPARIEEKAHV